MCAVLVELETKDAQLDRQMEQQQQHDKLTAFELKESQERAREWRLNKREDFEMAYIMK